MIRVLVVEDSLTIRKHLCEVLASDPEIAVAGEAQDGKRAIELCHELRPDVITMDMVLPVMSGLSATEFIMAYCPTPILIVSASTNRGELYRTYDALAAGAVDVLEKPSGDEPDENWARSFLSSVKLAARIRVITHPRARLAAQAAASLGAPPTPRVRAAPGARYDVVAIGASTGGPAAIVQLLKDVPAEFALPLLFVLHIGETFAMAFADWLDAQTGRRVRYAQDGEPLGATAGGVVMAPPDRHLVLRDGHLRLTRDAERHSCRPSVDVLFESLAQECGRAAAVCLLTGMGRDGASGMLAVRRAGGLTIAQDQATCVVHGMPREAILLGAAQRVLPLHAIGPAIAGLAE